MLNFYYVLYNTELNKYVKDFNLFNFTYTCDLMFAFRFFDKECALAILTDFPFANKQLRLKRVFLKEYDVLCVT